MRKKINIEDCQEFAKNKGGECLTLEYKNTDEKMEWMCKHGHKWYAAFAHIKRGTWCPYCSGRRNNSIELCREFALKRNGLCISIEYINNYIYMLWQCEYGHVWAAQFCAIKRGRWCKLCADNRLRHSIEECQVLAAKNNGKCLSTGSDYKNNKSLLLWQCSLGHAWKARACSITNGSWCPYCACVVKKTIDDCYKIATLRNGKCLSISIDNIRELLLWQCKNGHQWMANFNNIQTGHWCPHCHHQISQPQKEIYSFLMNNFPELNIVLNETQTIKPYELDIYIPSLKLAIEFDGEYWHYSEWAIEDGSLRRMKEKNQRCKSAKIKLIRIREKYWEVDKNKELTRLLTGVQINIANADAG